MRKFVIKTISYRNQTSSTVMLGVIKRGGLWCCHSVLFLNEDVEKDRLHGRNDDDLFYDRWNAPWPSLMAVKSCFLNELMSV